MNLRNTLLAATVLAAPFALAQGAKAQPVTGVYVGAGAGYNLEGSTKANNFVISKAQLPTEANLTFHNGFVGEASVGYGFGNGIRVEIQGNYYNNSFDKTKAYGKDYSASGQEEKYGALANVFYDFDVGLPFLYPYLGAGVGYDEVDYKDYSSAGLFVNKSQGGFAYQGIAGLAFPIAPVPGLSLTTEFRYLGINSVRKYSGHAPLNLPVTLKAESENNFSILAGLRYQLFTPPPVAPAPAPEPAAAPAPAPAKTYLVFFDWDKAKLTPRATEIIAQAASDSKTQSTTTIAVNGYTDTSGTAVYNQGLSVRRAKAVEAQLVADGVPESEITAQGFGDTNLLVPTGPGVREPQNRRVEIVLQ